MSEIQSIKTIDVTNALKFFIEMSMALSVDDAGFVFNSYQPSKDRIEIGPKDASKKVVVYMEELPKQDIYVINPFAEGLGDRTPPQVFFYKTLRASLNARLGYAVDGVMRYALEQQKLAETKPKDKKDKSTSAVEIRLPLRMVNILGSVVVEGKTIIDEVDDKMVEEFHKFFDLNTDMVIEPSYKPSLQRTDVHISIINNPNYVASISYMRKKSIAVLQTIIKAIFLVGSEESFEKFSSARIDGAASKLSSWLVTIFKLSQRLNEVIDCFEDEAASDNLINLDEYQYHLDRLAAYTNNAKWMLPASATVDTAAPTPIRMPGQMNPGTVLPVPPTTTPTTTASSLNVPPGYKLMPGVMLMDGTRGPPQIIPDYGPQSQIQQPQPFGTMPQQMPAMYPGMQQASPVVLPGMAPAHQQYGYQQPYQQPYQQQPPPPFSSMGGFAPNMNSAYSSVPNMPPLR